MNRSLAFALLCACLATTTFLAGCTSSDGPGEDEVFMQAGNVFEPQTITVEAGTRVTWVNKDSLPHTATADDDSFDSGYVNGGGKWSYTFQEPGTYTYHCTPHAVERDGGWKGMVGTVVVVAAGGAEPDDNATA